MFVNIHTDDIDEYNPTKAVDLWAENKGVGQKKSRRPDYKRKSSSQPDSQEQPETTTDTESESEDEDEIEGAGSDFENEEWRKLDEVGAVGGAGSFDFGMSQMMFE